MSKCKITANDLVNHLWDAMQANSEGDLDNARLGKQSQVAARIIRVKAENIKYKKLTNDPKKIDFFEEG